MKELLELAKEKGFSPWFFSDAREGDYLNLCLIQRWLREVYGIHVEVQREEGDEIYTALVCSENDLISNSSESKETYEEALQKGLEEGLKLI